MHIKTDRTANYMVVLGDEEKLEGEKKITEQPEGRGCPLKKKAKMKKEIISR